jgi:arsenate reductase (glutaredoxin)
MITIYHNARCSKSRAACDLVDASLNLSGEQVRIVEYLKQPPGVEELKELHRMLGGTIREMMRAGESIYQELGLDNPSLPDAVLYEAIAAHPLLLQRPIVVRDGKAVVGRPPEAIRTLFD